MIPSGQEQCLQHNIGADYCHYKPPGRQQPLQECPPCLPAASQCQLKLVTLECADALTLSESNAPGFTVKQAAALIDQPGFQLLSNAWHLANAPTTSPGQACPLLRQHLIALQ